MKQVLVMRVIGTKLPMSSKLKVIQI